MVDIGQGAHVAGALHIVLPAQGVHPAALEAHIAQKHLQVRAGEHVVHPAGVLGDAQSVHEHGRLVGRQKAGNVAMMSSAGTPEISDARSGGYSITLALSSSKPWVQVFHVLLVVEVLCDEHVHEAVYEGHVGAHLEPQVYLGERAPGRCCVWDPPGPAVAPPSMAFLTKLDGHRVGLGHVGPDDEEGLGLVESPRRSWSWRPEPKAVARPATVGACQVRAQWSMLFVPITARKSFCIW